MLRHLKSRGFPGPRMFHAIVLVCGLQSVAAAQVPLSAPAQPAASGTAAAGLEPVTRPAFVQAMDAEFRQMDTDHNGILTKTEIENNQKKLFAEIAQERNRAMFDKLDVDKNGQLSRGEFAALAMLNRQPNAAPLLAQVDINHDGSVTLLEFRTGKLRNFDNMDTDKDSVVSVEELKAAGLIK